jgi:hypothetical protein
VEEHLAGERVVARVQGRKPARHLEDVSVAGEPVEQARRAVMASSAVGRFLPGMSGR